MKNIEISEYSPLEVQLQALRDLIQCSVEKKDLIKGYHLIGHSQATATLCPGKYLFNEIKKWTHFDNSPH